MNTKEFKHLFSDIAKAKGFHFVSDYWYMESDDCIVVLELQKSNFGNFYCLNIKIFIQFAFNRRYFINNELKTDMGDIFRRPPSEYNICFDLDSQMEVEERKKCLESLFDNFIWPFSINAVSRKGIYDLSNENSIILQPAVKKQLDLINTMNE